MEETYVIGTCVRLSDYILSARATVAFIAESAYPIADKNGNGQYLQFVKGNM